MQENASLFIQIIFTGLFLVTVLAGGYLAKNFQRFFGVDASMPSEGVSSRTYTRTMVFLIWIHAFFLTGSFALLLH